MTFEIATASKPPLLSLPAQARNKPQKTKLKKRTNVIEEADKIPNRHLPDGQTLGMIAEL
jgi:hypothetical protein